ncbi:hypothetical protein, partial [Acutalibacter caecimuris]|uniref:hypothetical protein n=1 Tax=Acutalibacter caecimuris TaxID=3093657 RepID=UPI002AC90EC6
PDFLPRSVAYIVPMLFSRHFFALLFFEVYYIIFLLTTPPRNPQKLLSRPPPPYPRHFPLDHTHHRVPLSF